MELQNPSNGGGGGGEGGDLEDEGFFLDAAPNEDEEEEEEEEEEDEESSCSTPFVSAPSSPGNEPSSAMGSTVGLFYSAPTSPVHFALASSFPHDSPSDSPTFAADFEFSARFPAAAAGSMSAADELFLNGQIRPMRLASHLHRPHVLPPLPDLDPTGDDDDEEEEEIAARGRDLKLRSRLIRRRARSHSPLCNAPLHWAIEDGGGPDRDDRSTEDPDPSAPSVTPAAASRSSSSSSSASSSSSSSSSSRQSKKWIFLKELLNRSKSEDEGEDENGAGQNGHFVTPYPPAHIFDFMRGQNVGF